MKKIFDQGSLRPLSGKFPTNIFDHKSRPTEMESSALSKLQFKNSLSI